MYLCILHQDCAPGTGFCNGAYGRVSGNLVRGLPCENAFPGPGGQKSEPEGAGGRFPASARDYQG